MLLDYPGKPFVLYSYRDVVEGKVVPEVFVGSCAGSAVHDLADLFHVPRTGWSTGQRARTFVHAALADQLLSAGGSDLPPIPWRDTTPAPGWVDSQPSPLRGWRQSSIIYGCGWPGTWPSLLAERSLWFRQPLDGDPKMLLERDHPSLMLFS